MRRCCGWFPLGTDSLCPAEFMEKHVRDQVPPIRARARYCCTCAMRNRQRVWICGQAASSLRPGMHAGPETTGDCESSQTPRADAARVSRFGAGIARLAVGTRGEAAVQTGPVPLSSRYSAVLVGESRRGSRRISSTSDTDKPATPPMQPRRPGRLVRENGG